ncbi:hypothetical protein GCM10027046_30190 [Uliginosibacterium flavum]|uniref:Uncharacterized protein n=1 Tax=Uliginosibacterium flavum TaxID=1396831 RepID=A0ABV2TGC6_9RHOO
MGKLVATRDFKTYEYFKPNQTPCPAMRALAISISKSLDSWTQDVELRPCTEGCTGLHPETPILVAFPIQMQDGKSADPEMLAECGWQDYMRPMILDAYKRELRELERPAPEIEIRTEPFENPNGRTLKLTLVASHVIGGSSFTGPKWLNIHAELLDGGVAVDLGRGSGWLMGGYMNRCHNLTELSRKVAYDIARMLARPGVATREVY